MIINLKLMHMKKTILITSFILVIGVLLFTSCTKKFSQDANGYVEIQKEIMAKFGNDAYFTNISVTYDKNVGDVIFVTVTDDPESMKMESWNYMKRKWEKVSDIVLELEEGNIRDFMYQLKDEYDLVRVGELVELSLLKIQEEEQIKDAVAKTVTLNAPDDTTSDETQIFIDIEPRSGGTSFTFFYDLDGALIAFDY